MPAAVLAAFTTQPAGDAQTWSAFGASDAATRFSPAAQITPANVGQLVKLWEFHTGDLPPADNKAIQYAFQDTPQKIGDSLYVCTPSQILIALDPATGAEKWRHDPHVDRQAMANVYHAACRGVAYYEVPASNAPADCPRRILYGTSDARLLAVDAATGASCESFGTHGSVDLDARMGNSVPGFVSMNSAPIVVRGVVVVGHQVRDGQRDDAPSGVVRGYDAATGAFRWAWDMGRPGITSEPQRRRDLHQGHAQRLDQPVGRRIARAGLPADRQLGGRLLRRQPQALRGEVRLVDRRRRRRHRPAALVVPDRAPRPLGLRPRLAGDAGRFPERRHDDRRRWSCRASTARSTCSIAPPASRSLPVTETPVPQGAAAGDFTAPTQPISPSMPDIIGPNLHREGRLGHHADRPADLQDPVHARSLRGPLHAAEPAGLDRLSRLQRRRRLGRRRRRSRAPDPGRQQQPDRQLRPAADARTGRRQGDQGARRAGRLAQHADRRRGAARRALRRQRRAVDVAALRAVHGAALGLPRRDRPEDAQVPLAPAARHRLRQRPARHPLAPEGHDGNAEQRRARW